MTYKTIKTMVESELDEKKSRFICILTPLAEVSETEEFLAKIRKQYPGARHYCYAYRLRSNGNILERYSDDGEPNSTAGVPMLSVLQKHELENVLAVAVRYFGGTLLGTGGLVRAYSGAVLQTLNHAEVIIMEFAWQLAITIDYSHYGSFQNKCLRYFNQIIDTQFTNKVHIKAWLAADRLEQVRKILDDISVRTAEVECMQEGYVIRQNTQDL